MYKLNVRDHFMIAHSFHGEAFGPAQRLHGATYVVDATFKRDELDPDGLVVDIALAGDQLKKILEEFNYPGTLSAYRSLKLDMVGIKLDEGGMRIDHMEDELKRLDKQKKRPKFIYAISTYQNPTGFNMPKSRRLEMIDLANKYDVPIVEDNCYADVHYEGEVEPAIYALDDNPNHIYLCLLYTSPSPRDGLLSRMPSSA